VCQSGLAVSATATVKGLPGAGSAVSAKSSALVLGCCETDCASAGAARRRARRKRRERTRAI
jgi:hypothetical protein